MKKRDREIVFNKYGGRCSYCGCDLGKLWHVDHVKPVNRISKIVEGYYRHKITREKISPKDIPDRWHIEYEYVSQKSVFDRMMNPENDNIENSIPSCQSCNLYKSAMDIETFRENVGLLVSRLNKNFTQYKIAKRYGLIEEKIKPIVFYFETFKQETNFV